MSIATPEPGLRAIQTYKCGKGTQQHIADLYGIHVNTLKNWLKDYDREERITPGPGGHMRQALSEEDKKLLHDMVMEKNDMTLKEMRERFNNKCSIMAIWNELNRQGLRLKKL